MKTRPEADGNSDRNVYPAEMGGAPGRRPSFSGSDGCLAPNAESIATSKAFANGGAREGGPSPIPSRDRSGAFMPDESIQCYSGNPRDDGCGTNGSRGSQPNRFPGR